MRGSFFKKTMVAMIAATTLLVGCGTGEGPKKDFIKAENVDVLPTITIVVKDYGTIKAELYPEEAPNTVNNFIDLASSGFYDGLSFHRVIKDFMIQGGDPKGDGTGGPDYTILGEFAGNGYENNTLKHEEGVLSMARMGSDMDSAGSQFFIVTKTTKSLDRIYAAFGKVTEGMEVVHAIEKVETDANDMPKTPVIIQSITVDTHGITYAKPEKLS